jgi:hypothetical protein
MAGQWQQEQSGGGRGANQKQGHGPSYQNTHIRKLAVNTNMWKTFSKHKQFKQVREQRRRTTIHDRLAEVEFSMLWFIEMITRLRAQLTHHSPLVAPGMQSPIVYKHVMHRDTQVLTRRSNSQKSSTSQHNYTGARAKQSRCCCRCRCRWRCRCCCSNETRPLCTHQVIRDIAAAAPAPCLLVTAASWLLLSLWAVCDTLLQPRFVTNFYTLKQTRTRHDFQEAIRRHPASAKRVYGARLFGRLSPPRPQRTH